MCKLDDTGNILCNNLCKLEELRQLARYNSRVVGRDHPARALTSWWERHNVFHSDLSRTRRRFVTTCSDLSDNKLRFVIAFTNCLSDCSTTRPLHARVYFKRKRLRCAKIVQRFLNLFWTWTNIFFLKKNIFSVKLHFCQVWTLTRSWVWESDTVVTCPTQLRQRAYKHATADRSLAKKLVDGPDTEMWKLMNESDIKITKRLHGIQTSFFKKYVRTAYNVNMFKTQHKLRIFWLRIGQGANFV